MTEEDARTLMAQLLLSADFMARKSIVHRDLKPENLLLRSKEKGVYEIRIADFGFAVQMDSNKPLTEDDKHFICGTAGYIAPEILQFNGHSAKSDIFSLGSILYSVLTLKNLFPSGSYNKMALLNRQCKLTHIDYSLRRYSPEARDFVKWLLTKDPAKRPTAKEALGHAWFTHEQEPLQSSLNFNKLLVECKPDFHRRSLLD
jgi:calcium/calmodulin-dependent protein kinase I